ncbi:MAG: diphthine synthase [Methanomassiliicoccaceae archaeon]|jgi:diphthine synthase|nr:diphthine synthase [Methanomassiliicoccaceae archaeon]
MRGLIFAGLGLSGVDGMTVKALNALRGCDVIFAEFYTSVLMDTDVAELEKTVGKRIKVLHRAQVEEDDTIIGSARTSRTGFVTAGDTMAATTHVDLLIQAAEEGIPTEVFHGVSIFSACPASLGLQPYKFGRTVTLPFIDGDYHPRSPYDHLVANKRDGLHSMVLLDIRADEMRYMTAHQAIEWLLEGERKWKCGLVTDETIICVASRIGSDSEKVFAGYPGDLLGMDLGTPLHTLVIPGQLHFMESYALVHLAGAPASLIRDD